MISDIASYEPREIHVIETTSTNLKTIQVPNRLHLTIVCFYIF